MDISATNRASQPLSHCSVNANLCLMELGMDVMVQKGGQIFV